MHGGVGRQPAYRARGRVRRLDAWVYSKPYGNAQHGGDVYYASSCGQAGSLAYCWRTWRAGVSVASTAADLRTLMRRFVNRVDQTEFVRLLNQQFVALSKKGARSPRRWWPRSSSHRPPDMCNAGHPRPLLYRAGGQGGISSATCRSEQPGSQAIGWSQQSAVGNAGNIAVRSLDIELEPGDRVLSYTDALIESNDAKGEALGENGVLRILRLSGDLAPQTLIENCWRRLKSVIRKNLTEDDVTVLVVEANGAKAHYTFRENYRPLRRLTWSVVRGLNPKAERPPLPDLNLANLGGAIIPALGRRWRAKPEN